MHAGPADGEGTNVNRGVEEYIKGIKNGKFGEKKTARGRRETAAVPLSRSRAFSLLTKTTVTCLDVPPSVRVYLMEMDDKFRVEFGSDVAINANPL